MNIWILRKGVHFFPSQLDCYAFSIQLGLKRNTFCEKKLNVKWKQITYHIMQITVNQIMQASLSNFKEFLSLIIVKNNKGVAPTPPLSKIECIFKKFQVRIWWLYIFFRELLVMCFFYYIITQLYTTNLMFKLEGTHRVHIYDLLEVSIHI